VDDTNRISFEKFYLGKTTIMWLAASKSKIIWSVIFTQCINMIDETDGQCINMIDETDGQCINMIDETDGQAELN